MGQGFRGPDTQVQQMLRSRVRLLRLCVLLVVGALAASANTTVRSAPSGSTSLMIATGAQWWEAQLYTLDVDSGERRSLSQQPRPGIGPRWSPDRRQLAFLSETGLSVINSDGSGEQMLTGVPGGLAPIYWSPFSWSPDGRRIAFAAYGHYDKPCPPLPADDPCRYRVFVINADGTGRIPLTTLPGESIYPVWSPDGRQLAFLYLGLFPARGPGSIYVANADGTGLRQVVTGGSGLGFAADSSITWAPDGRRLVFDVGLTRDPWIFSVSVAGGDPTRLVKGFSPTWAPDGRRLAYISAEDWQVYTMNADGDNRTRLTPQGPPRVVVRWSPDGRQMAIVSYNEVPNAIELLLDIVNADGTGFRRLTRLVGLPSTRPYAVLPIGRLLIDW